MVQRVRESRLRFDLLNQRSPRVQGIERDVPFDLRQARLAGDLDVRVVEVLVFHDGIAGVGVGGAEHRIPARAEVAAVRAGAVQALRVAGERGKHHVAGQILAAADAEILAHARHARMVRRLREVIGLVVAAVVAGHHAVRVVRVVFVRDAPHDSHLVQASGEHRQVFADAVAGQHGGDGLELAADAVGGVRLGIEGIDVRRPAEEIEQDDVLGFPRVRIRSSGRDGRDPREERCQRSGAKQIAAGNSRSGRRVAEYAEHS